MFEALSDKLTSVFSRFQNKGRITEKDLEEGLKEVRIALLEADVNFRVTRKFIEDVKSRSIGKDVLESIIQRMAHVERAGDIGWGDDDGESGTFGEIFPLEGVAFHPPLEPPGFGGVRFIPLRQHRGSVSLFEALDFAFDPDLRQLRNDLLGDLFDQTG